MRYKVFFNYLLIILFFLLVLLKILAFPVFAEMQGLLWPKDFVFTVINKYPENIIFHMWGEFFIKGLGDFKGFMLMYSNEQAVSTAKYLNTKIIEFPWNQFKGEEVLHIYLIILSMIDHHIYFLSNNQFYYIWEEVGKMPHFIYYKTKVLPISVHPGVCVKPFLSFCGLTYVKYPLDVSGDFGIFLKKLYIAHKDAPYFSEYSKCFDYPLRNVSFIEKETFFNLEEEDFFIFLDNI